MAIRPMRESVNIQVRSLQDKGRLVIETHLRTGRSIDELAQAYDMDRSWLYRRLARYRCEGEAGLEPHLQKGRLTFTLLSTWSSDSPHRAQAASVGS